MSTKFKVGDVVVLKSGGPRMTVTEDKDDKVWTTWFAGSKNERGLFPVNALVAYQEEKAS